MLGGQGWGPTSRTGVLRGRAGRAGACVQGPGAQLFPTSSGAHGRPPISDVDECASHPCQNGGTCTHGVNSFSCECPAGFRGLTCETGKRPTLGPHGIAGEGESKGIAVCLCRTGPIHVGGKKKPGTWTREQAGTQVGACRAGGCQVPHPFAPTCAEPPNPHPPPLHLCACRRIPAVGHAPLRATLVYSPVPAVGTC